jgi:hypothetical protein
MVGFYFSPVFEHHALTDDSDDLEASIQHLNLRHTWMFYCYIALLLLIFGLTKPLRQLYIRHVDLRRYLRWLAVPGRLVRRLYLKPCFYPFATIGHFLVVLGYLVMNTLLCLMTAENKLLLLQLARRTGW